MHEREAIFMERIVPKVFGHTRVKCFVLKSKYKVLLLDIYNKNDKLVFFLNNAPEEISIKRNALCFIGSGT